MHGLSRASFLGISLSLTTTFMALSQDSPRPKNSTQRPMPNAMAKELQGGLAQSLTDAVWQFGF